MNILRHALTIARFAVSVLEALMKCLPVFVIQLLALYPLIAVGQGREAMRALLDATPGNISWLVFSLSSTLSFILTGFFLFFLLDRWNYSADTRERAFCRIWLPFILMLTIGLVMPISVELSPRETTFWDAVNGFVIVVLAAVLLVAAWKRTNPVLSRRVFVFSAVACIVLVSLWVFGLLPAFYVGSYIAVTVFCWFIADDFRDGNQNFEPWKNIHRVGLCWSFLFALTVYLLSRTPVQVHMFLGAPSIIMFGFTFMAALAFLVSALLSLISPVLVRASWFAAIAILFLSPVNHEPIRTLQPVSGVPSRQPPSVHFIEWLRNRPEIQESTKPYPVFFVAAQGGGVRAAYWTSTLLAGLEERYPGFTNHVYAISGVSGGSVGGTLFTTLYRDRIIRGDSRCAPLVAGGIHGTRPCASYLFQWDLLGPPLSGLLLNDLPFSWHEARRASFLEQGLENAWLATTNARHFEGPFQDLWKEHPYQIPSLILNTTSADDGHRIVVSNLRAKGEITPEPDVEELMGRSLRLSTAAFLSARFPIISPVAVGSSPHHGAIRLVDGGYFNNSGVASVSRLLRAILPVASNSGFAGRIQPVVLVISSSPVSSRLPKGRLAGSFAGALLEPVSVLENTGDAHEATYLKEVADLVGEKRIAADLRPPQGTLPVALGWMLSANTRCAMDTMVNTVLNESGGSAAIGLALGKNAGKPATWTSCRANQ